MIGFALILITAKIYQNFAKNFFDCMVFKKFDLILTKLQRFLTKFQ